MSNDFYARYCAIEEKLETDEELNHPKQRLRETSEQLRILMSQLTEEQRQILAEYLGTCAEADQRIVEIACFFDNV